MTQAVHHPAEALLCTPDGSDLLVLAVCAVVLGLSIALHNAPDGRVSLGREGSSSLPALCPFKRATGLDCPGCGMTRSFVAVGHLDLRSAWQYHRLGILLYALVALQIPYRLLRLLWPSFYCRTRRCHDAITGAGLITLAALILLTWGLRLLGVL